jgi:hypothetical protein
MAPLEQLFSPFSKDISHLNQLLWLTLKSSQMPAKMSTPWKLPWPRKISNKFSTIFLSTIIHSASMFQSEHLHLTSWHIARRKTSSISTQWNKNGKVSTLIPTYPLGIEPIMLLDIECLPKARSLTTRKLQFHAVEPIQEWSAGLSSKE